jgi:hypothetical protein
MDTNLNVSEFDQMISLRDAYRCMEAFVEAYLARGDGAVSEFFDFYVSSPADDLARNTAAVSDFLNAYRTVCRDRHN